jgi:hypothetical protein
LPVVVAVFVDFLDHGRCSCWDIFREVCRSVISVVRLGVFFPGFAFTVFSEFFGLGDDTMEGFK